MRWPSSPCDDSPFAGRTAVTQPAQNACARCERSLIPTAGRTRFPVARFLPRREYGNTRNSGRRFDPLFASHSQGNRQRLALRCANLVLGKDKGQATTRRLSTDHTKHGLTSSS